MNGESPRVITPAGSLTSVDDRPAANGPASERLCVPAKHHRRDPAHGSSEIGPKSPVTSGGVGGKIGYRFSPIPQVLYHASVSKRLGLTDFDFKVLGVLHMHARDKGRATASQGTIARILGVGRPAVNASLARFKAAGLTRHDKAPKTAANQTGVVVVLLYWNDPGILPPFPDPDGELADRNESSSVAAGRHSPEEGCRPAASLANAPGRHSSVVPGRHKEEPPEEFEELPSSPPPLGAGTGLAALGGGEPAEVRAIPEAVADVLHALGGACPTSPTARDVAGVAELLRDCGPEIVEEAARRVERDWRDGKLTTTPVRRLASIALGMKQDGGFHGQAPPSPKQMTKAELRAADAAAEVEAWARLDRKPRPEATTPEQLEAIWS